MDQKSFETIHGMIGQSIRDDKQCLNRYKKENNRLQKNDTFFPYTNRKTKKDRSFSDWNYKQNKNNRNVQKEEYTQGTFRYYKISGPFENDFKYNLNKKDNHKNNKHNDIQKEKVSSLYAHIIVNNNENDFVSKIQN